MKDYKQIEMRLSIYARWLLYIFIALLVAHTLIVRIQPGIYVKEAIIQDQMCQPNCLVPENIYGYDRITLQEINELKNRQLYINILGFTGIIGWCIFNPDFRKGLRDKIKWLKDKGL